jgi:hypothetical protein
MIVNYNSNIIYYKDDAQNPWMELLVIIDKNLLNNPYKNNPKYNRFYIRFKPEYRILIDITYDNITHIGMLSVKSDITTMFDNFKNNGSGTIIEFLNYITENNRNKKLEQLGL